MEGRIVSPEHASVEVRAFGVLFLHRAKMSRLDYMDGDVVAVPDETCDIEGGPLESSLDCTQTASVHEDFGLRVDPVEAE